jgi:hypothetical protein
MEQLQTAVIEFSDGFVEAFRSFNGSQIADRYLVLYVALRADGSINCQGSSLCVNQRVSAPSALRRSNLGRGNAPTAISGRGGRHTIRRP